MAPRARRTLIAAVVLVAGAGAGAVALAVLPRSGPPDSRIAVRGAAGAAHGALDMSGRAALSGPARADTAKTSVGSPSTMPGTNVASTSTTISPGTTGTTGRSSTTTGAAATTTVPEVATAGPATGRLVVTVVQPGGARAIATMAADGGGERVLATGDYIDPHWTPDGRFVLFESMGAYASWAVPAAGGPVTRVGDGAVAVVSPDATAVINVMAVPYATGLPQLTVQKIAETSSGLVTVGPATPLGVSGVGPVWSPDGRRILYNTEMGGSSGLAIVDADGTGRHDLLASAAVKAAGMDHPGFSADSSTISFLGSDSVVYFIGSDGQGLRRVLPGASGQAAFVTSWSADHRRLAVLGNGGNAVVVVDAAGHVVATAHLSVGASPVGIALDGSGQHVFYMGIPGNTPQSSRLYSVALAGGPSQRVGTDGSAGFPLSVHPG